MNHAYHDKTRKKEKVEVACSTCKSIFSVRKDTSREWYREYKGYGPLQCPACVSNDLSERNRQQVGEKNPRWKGGISKEGKSFYSSPEWKALRVKVFERDGYKCVKCHKSKRLLEANHIKPRAKNLDLRLEISNIETLCRKCHTKKTILQHKQGLFK